MPAKRKRNYKKEYASYHGKKKQVKRRSLRNQARRKMKLKVGDKREVDHKKPLSKGGTNRRSNIRVTTKKANRKKYNK
jgi:5-methylcytosine-specific restriction endonuclease McrA